VALPENARETLLASRRLRASDPPGMAIAHVRRPVGKSRLSENSKTKSRKPETGTTKSAPVFTSFAASSRPTAGAPGEPIAGDPV
jgi:hypothetical protein